jgi:hypothetical protein
MNQLTQIQKHDSLIKTVIAIIGSAFLFAAVIVAACLQIDI